MCFAEMFALIAKHNPASFPWVPFFILLSISFACSIALGFNSRKMFRSFVFGVEIFLEKFRRFSTAVSLPSFICFSFCLRVIVVLHIMLVVSLFIGHEFISFVFFEVRGFSSL